MEVENKKSLRPIEREFRYTKNMIEKKGKTREMAQAILSQLYKTNLQLNATLISKNRDAQNEKENVYKLSSEVKVIQQEADELPKVVQKLVDQKSHTRENLKKRIRELKQIKSLNEEKIANLTKKVEEREKAFGLRLEAIPNGVRMVFFNLLENNESYECYIELNVDVDKYAIGVCKPDIEEKKVLLDRFNKNQNFKLF